jgi:hypothetical protein
MNLLILGAGASKSYTESTTKVKMPIAKDFFNTFNQLSISQNQWVLVGAILNYLKTFHKIPWTGFLNYSQDIEVLHSEVEERLNFILEKNIGVFSSPENILIYQTYLQLIFLFTSVINEIQNGPASKSHINLAKCLNKEDNIITFNWDTLMERALRETTNWNSESGYLIRPSKIYRNDWIENTDSKTIDYPIILKLHGSTNWLTSYLQPDVTKLKSMQETPTDDFYIYESAIDPYHTYKGRFMSGYTDFSYGYYPPNLPLRGEGAPKGHFMAMITISPKGMHKPTSESGGLVSMPLIIPPVKYKNYSHFGTIFNQLWERAEKSIRLADRIIIIGYSFPKTDIQTDILFRKALIQRTSLPEIFIVDPYPENIVDRFILEYGIKKNKIQTYKSFFSQDFDVKPLFMDSLRYS